jgi:hypothetical protein
MGNDCDSSEEAEWKLASEVAGDGENSRTSANLYPFNEFSGASTAGVAGSDGGEISVSDVDAVEVLVFGCGLVNHGCARI